MKIIKGIDTARPLREELERRVSELKIQGVRPQLAVVRVGNNPSDKAYLRGIRSRALELGIELMEVVLDKSIEQDHLNNQLESLSSNSLVHGIMLMRPLPNQCDEREAARYINPAKDVDGMCEHNLAGVFMGKSDAFAPCTAEAVVRLLVHEGYELAGKNVCIIGRSAVVGRPLAALCTAADATVTLCHSKTVDLSDKLRSADIVISCTGYPRLVKVAMVSPDTVVIDVGVSFVEGEMVGDVDFDEVSQMASAITPVRGGVGALTSTILMEHLVISAEKSLRATGR